MRKPGPLPPRLAQPGTRASIKLGERFLNGTIVSREGSLVQLQLDKEGIMLTSIHRLFKEAVDY